jgi:hypothetical protein
VSVRVGTRMPLSASSVMPGASRARARAGPTGSLVGRRRLVELDGGAWDLLAKELVLASLLCHSSMGRCSGHIGERGRGQGEVCCSCPCRVGSRRGWSGDAGHWLGVRGGGEGEEREGEDLT